MNQFKTIILLGLLSGLLIGVSSAIIKGPIGAIIGLGIAAIMNISSWYFSDQIALAAYNAQPVSVNQAPELYNLIEILAQRANIPMPGVYIIPTDAANAFATGRDPEHAAVAVTEGILNTLPEDELEGVIAHELSHIKNRDTLTQTVAVTIASAISWLAQMASYAIWFTGGSRDNRNNSNPIVLLLTIILAPLAATVIQLAISRTREFSADTGAAQLTGNPRALARALQRLENNARQISLEGNPAFSPLLIINFSGGDWVKNLFSTHPSTEARVENLLQLETKMSNNLPPF